MASREDPRSISRFRWLVVCFANEITNKELKQAKFLVKDRLGAKNFEDIKDTFDFFDKLQEGNHFHEGDTLLLRHILDKINRQDLIGELNKYNSEYAVVARRYRTHPAASEGPFIGRKDRLEELFRLLQEKYDDGVATICISGLPGMGKTRLAKEACYRLLEYHELLFVDLRELSTTESILYAVMHAVGEDTTLNLDMDVLIMKLKKFRPKKAGGAVLLFDNADRPLRTPKEGVNDDVYNNFVELIERIVECGNDCLKVLITTRMGLPRKICARYKKCVFPISIRADELEYDDARDILQYYAGRTKISDDEAEQLVNICGKCPLALKVTGSRLQDHIIRPGNLVKHLSKKTDVTQLGFYGDVNLEACLKNTFDSLPDNQKLRMIRLSSIPGTFTGRAALAILGMKRGEQVEVNLQLQDLKYRNLIETSINDNEDFNKSDVRYGLHLLMRQFLQRIAETDKDIKVHYERGEQEFVGYFLRKLKKVGQLSEKRYRKAMKRKHEDSANFQELLKLLPKQRRTIETDEWRVISNTVELFYSTQERLKFFKAQRELEYENKNILQFVEMSAYEGLQMSRINYRYDEILPILKSAEEELLKTTQHTEVATPVEKRSYLGLSLFKKKSAKYFAETYAQTLNAHEKERLILLYQLWGNVCTTCVKDLDEANERIQIAYNLVKELNPKHTNTARFYSTMADLILIKSRVQQSNAVCEKSKVREALKYYEKAYELRRDLTGSEHHPDIPVYLANIGSCYYQLEEIEDSITYYKRSLTVEDEMVIDNEEAYLKTLRNLALAFRDIDRYEDAIDFGERCLRRRVELLGIHTDTARTYYLVGLFYMERENRGDLKEAEYNFNEALKVEEELWRLGKPHSVDWDNLKGKITRVLAKTGQKMKYPAYKRRFDISERKSTQRPIETVITDTNVELDSSDDSIEGDAPIQELDNEQMAIQRRDSTSGSDDDDTMSLVSKDSGVSSMASSSSREGQPQLKKPRKARKENLQ